MGCVIAARFFGQVDVWQEGDREWWVYGRSDDRSDSDSGSKHTIQVRCSEFDDGELVWTVQSGKEDKPKISETFGWYNSHFSGKNSLLDMKLGGNQFLLKKAVSYNSTTQKAFCQR